MEKTIGLAIITYERPEYFKQCLKAAREHVGEQCEIVVADDGSMSKEKRMLLKECLNAGIRVIYDTTRSVAKNKNRALQYLMGKKYNHIFLMEDDIIIKSPDVLTKYIEYAKEHKLHHLNFAHHGPANKKYTGEYNGIRVYPNSVGAFSYYTRECLEDVGLLDEQFTNAWEHVEHTFRLGNAGYTTPFWKFADHPQSKELLEEIPGSIDQSSIRPNEDWESNMEAGMMYWAKKHKMFLPPREGEFWSQFKNGTQ